MKGRLAPDIEDEDDDDFSSTVGTAVGTLIVSEVGFCVGLSVDPLVGKRVGKRVGIELLRYRVGAAVGLDVITDDEISEIVIVKPNSSSSLFEKEALDSVVFTADAQDVEV